LIDICRLKGGAAQGLIRSQKDLFRNTAPKTTAGVSLAVVFYLADKSLFWKRFAVLGERFLFTGAAAGCRNVLCISKPRGFLWRKGFRQNRVNSYPVPPKGGIFIFEMLTSLSLNML
jgi:hypothetical protein